MAAPIQWLSVNGGNDNYYELITVSSTWDDARAAAEAMSFGGQSGYLATITSAEEQDFLSQMVNPTGIAAWLGASDNAVDDVWRWVTGPEAGTLFYQGEKASGGACAAGAFCNWATNEPNDFSGRAENYLQGWWSGDRWNDRLGGNRYAFLVEYGPAVSPVPLPAGLPLFLGALLGLRLVARRRRV